MIEYTTEPQNHRNATETQKSIFSVLLWNSVSLWCHPKLII